MPITIDGLKDGLLAGAKSYNLKTLGWNPASETNSVRSSLKIQVFTAADVKLQTYAASATGFIEPVESPTGTAKTYLGGSEVCNITTSGVAGKIYFALMLNDVNVDLSTTTSNKFSGGFNHVSPIPAVDPATTPEGNYGDIFMVVTLDPTINVTLGGYLTVKGYSGTTESENYTYITLTSGVDS